MAVDIGPKIGIDGEAQFRKDISQINQSIKTLGSEMKAVTSEFEGQEKSVESLSKQNEVLERTVGELNSKLEMQKQMLQECALKYGETDEKTLKWLQAVNETQAALNKANNEIDRNKKGIDDLNGGIGETTESMEEGEEEAKTFGQVLMANLASQAIIGGVKALGNAIRGVFSMMGDAAGAADEILTLSTQTGLSTDQIQKFQYASELIDVPLETLTGSLSKLTKQMASAQGGTGEAADTFAELGVSVTNADGSLRDNEDVFNDTIAALGKIDNETERDAQAMKIFGKSAQELNPLILGGADALQKYGEEAEAAGLILSEGELSDLGTVDDNINRLTQSIDMAKSKLVSSFAEPVSEALNVAVGSVQRLSQAFAEGGWDGLAQEMGSVVTEAVQYMTEHLDEVVGFAKTFISTLVSGIGKALPDLMGAALDILTTLINDIAENLPTLIPAAVDILMQIVDTIIEHAPDMLTAATELIVNLAKGLIDAIPKIIEKIPDIIAGIVNPTDGLLSPDSIQSMIDAGIDLLVNIVGNIPEIVAGIVKAIPDIIAGIVGGFLGLAGDFLDLGKQLMNKIWEGMKSVAGAVGDWVNGLFTGSGDSSYFTEKLDAMAYQAGYYKVGGEYVPKSEYKGMEFDDTVGQGIVGNASAPNNITLVTPDGDTLANYITPSLGSATKSYGQPLLNPYS